MELLTFEFFFLIIPLFMSVSAIKKNNQIILIIIALLFYFLNAPADFLFFIFYISISYVCLLSKNLYAVIMINIILLFVFKYLDGWILNYLTNGTFLPLALSFLAFQNIALAIDIRRGKTKIPPILQYLTFITFFPQLFAGPICRFTDLSPQLQNQNRSRQNLILGSVACLIGLFKKLVLVPIFAIYSGTLYNQAAIQELSQIEAWVGVIAYSLELYFDFSAYADLAIGIGLLFGVALPQNFNSPYKARSISEFWQRWHITLHLFFKDYIYKPLCNQFKFSLTSRIGACFLICFLSGVWHGNSVGFIVWAIGHSTLITIELILKRYLPQPVNIFAISVFEKIFNMLRVIAVFLLVTLLWVPFRAESMTDAITIIEVLFRLDHSNGKENLNATNILSIPLITVGILVVWMSRNTQSILMASQPLVKRLNRQYWGKSTKPLLIVLYLTFFGLVAAMFYLNELFFQSPTEFIYFKF
ncbi:MBOAT family protein [Litorivicinus sp.]|nr:MBOAT family protein [Litorivicinus sp.]